MALIFLSYARADDEPFVVAVHQRLIAEGLSVWWDRECMPSRALTFLQEIRQAIDAAARMVVIIGPRALTSDYVRAEWQHALAEDKVVTPVVRLGDHTLLPPELRVLHCPDGRSSRPPEDILGEIVRVLREPEPPLGPVRGEVPGTPPHFQPRPDDLSAIAGAMLIDDRHPVTLTDGQRVVLLYAMGGAGKTVLASSFARSTAARRAFPGGVFWVDGTGDPGRELAVLLGGTVLPGAALRDQLAGRRAMVVVDDVWTVEQLEPVVAALDTNTRVLVTTREPALAAAVGARTLELGLLSEDAALRQLADWSGVSPDQLPPEAAELAQECGCLPLALAINGAMLGEGVLWSDLLEKLREADLAYAERKFVDYDHPTVYRAMKVGVDRLRSTDPGAADRYFDLAAFMSGATVPEPAIAMLWEHRAGLDGASARKLLATLAGKALLRLEGTSPDRRVTLHALQWDFLGDRELDGELLAAYRERCADDWPSGPADGYFHRRLITHLLRMGDQDEVRRLLALEDAGGRNAWFEASESAGTLDAYVNDLDAAPDPLGDAMLASLSSLARALPRELRVALVREGLWSGAQAVAEASQIPKPDDRVYALIALMAVVGGDDRRAAFAEALDTLSDQGPHSRAPLLAALAGQVEGDERAALVRDALSAARLIQPGYHAEAIGCLLPFAGKEDRPALCAEALEMIAAQIEDAGPNEGGFLEPVQLLVPYVDAAGLESLLELARRIPSDFDQAGAFAALAERRPDVVAEGLALEARVQANSLWIHLSLRAHEPGASPSELVELAIADDARQAAHAIRLLPDGDWDAVRARIEAMPDEQASDRFDALVALLPRLAPGERPPLVTRLFDSVPALPYQSWRASAYSALAPYLDGDRLLAARTGARVLDDGAAVGAALTDLYPRLVPELRERVVAHVLAGHAPFTLLVALAEQHAGAVPAALASFDRREWLTGQNIERTLARLAPLTPERWADVLNAGLRWVFTSPQPAGFAAAGFAELAPQLPPDLRDTGIGELLQRAQAERELPWVLRELGPVLEGRQRASAIELARGLHEPSARLEALAAVVPEDGETRTLAHAAAATVDPADLSAVLALAPLLDPHERSALHAQAAEYVKPVFAASFAAQLDPDAALIVARRMLPAALRAGVGDADELVTPLAGAPAEIRAAVIAECHAALRARPRDEFAHAAATLSPLLTDAEVCALADALLRVRRWWP